ncbi:protein kinase [Streptomyces sp. NPDC000395]
MGEVWRATDEVLRRTVAVKLLLGDDPASQAAARFRLEAQTAARLSHPNIVGVFDFGARDGRFYLVMELVEGQSLAQELNSQGTLRAERVAAIAAQAAAGLASAHRTGIVHRDIKPGNLMSDADGTVKIGDFGIARFVDDPATALTTAGQIIGTSLYLAPERALGRPASPASDVYSLGCLLYQLLTGTPPFQADTSAATLAQHIDAAPVPPSGRGAALPPAFENYLLGMLAKQPEDRPSAQQIADWFGSGAWQGRPEPMPQPAPGPAPMQGPPPHAQVFGTATPASAPTAMPPATPPRAPEAPSVATYRLPQPAATRPDRRRRPTPAAPPASASAPPSAKRRGVRELIRRRPRVASLIAGVLAFLIAILIGVVWL